MIFIFHFDWMGWMPAGMSFPKLLFAEGHPKVGGPGGRCFFLFVCLNVHAWRPAWILLLVSSRGTYQFFFFFAFSFFWSSNDQCVRSTCTPKPSIPSASFHISSLYLCFHFGLSWEIVYTITILIFSCLCKYSLKLKIVHKFTLEKIYIFNFL